MFSIDEIVIFLKKRRKELKLSKFRLAVLAHIAETSTRNMDKDDWNPTVNTIRKLQEVLK